MKYLVISTYERNSKKEGLFSTLEEARRKMLNLLENHFSERLEESFEDYEEDFDWGIEERSCWSNASDEDFDVNIYEIENDNCFVVISARERIFSFEGCFSKALKAYCYMEDLLEKYFEKDLQEELDDCSDSRDDEWGLETDFAWSNMYNKNFDINIFQISKGD